MKKSDEEWKQKLNDIDYKILRQKGTELPFSGKYNNHFKKGVYNCKGCGQKLFSSENKFNNNCGWPSYDRAFENSLIFRTDTTHGMIRTEIICSNCEGHQGHLFKDGPTKTNERYCVNSASINFVS
jgi:peptide-methionine (R)-S-oxide reductase